MTARERFHAVMRFEPVDRLPLVEWAAWWDETVARWEAEGLPRGLDRYELYEYFGLDMWYQDWWRPLHWEAPKPARHGMGIIEDESGYEGIRGYLYQILERWPIDPVRWREWCEAQRRGAVVWFTVDGFFWFSRVLLGIERHLYAFYDQPKLLHRINTELAEWMVRMIERVCEICVPDFMTFAEDMSYNHGPMLSEALFNEFLLPYYQRVVPELKRRGIWVFVDSDGDVSAAVPWFERAGIEGILPLERQSGVDVGVLRRRHPRMRFIGHYDKLVMSKGSGAMRAEFERLIAVARQGGFIISCDHQTPPEVSLANYWEYVKLFREYAEQVGGRGAREIGS
ncbi:MAG: hypothetical protein N2595_08145 [bacterium]|nr:hypothetical protein [bacterium]